MMNPTSILHRLLDRVFPKSPDFFALLAEQASQAVHTVNLLVDFMGTGDPELGKQIRQDEHAADAVKVRNIHTLNEAFSTDIDREDIYRAIITLDDIVNSCKDCVNEMDILGVAPDKYTYELAAELRNGCQALATGLSRLGTAPAQAAADADAARKHGRAMEKLFRKALADLFQGQDYVNMFRRREIYRHLDVAGERLEHCANTVQDIVVKLG